MIRRTRHNAKPRRGIAVVELAVALPVFVLILLATIETCTMIFLQQTLKIAAHEGVRAAVVPGSTSTNVTNTASAFLMQRSVNATTITITPSNYTNLPYGTALQVQVSAPCNSNCVFPPLFYSGRIVTGASTMMKEF
jgi:Flp pilus assembly protein TadG